MKLKPGVHLKELQPQLVFAALIVQSIYHKHAHEATVTSANDGQHKSGSLHYEGFALDFRIKDFQGNKTALAVEVADALGSDFDVVLEDLGKPNEHLHVEYDPG